MPKIETTKELVALLNNEPPAGMALEQKDGKVVMLVKNEQVTHFVTFRPDEALTIGCHLIQLGGIAQNVAQVQAAEADKQRMNGLLKP